MQKNREISFSVYITDSDVFRNQALYDQAFSLCTAERRRKTERYRIEKDRRMSVTAELLLKKALHDSDIALTDIEYEYGPQGKPFIKDHPEICFNLSHAGGYAMCAVAGCEIGCDIEEISRANLTVARRFFTAGEYERILSCSSRERDILFTRYWTLKESFMKATGLGLQLSLSSFEIQIDASDTISVRQEADNMHYSFSEIDAISGLRAAVCIAECDEKPAVAIVSALDLLR